jgi:predicted nucleic acid-binding protein
MASSTPALTSAVLDASLVAKWYAPHEPGWEHAQVFRRTLESGQLHVAAPEYLKVEVVRVLQLGVRDKRYSVEVGLERVDAFLTLPLTYLADDLLFEGAFRLASSYQMALYDGLYLTLARVLEAPFITADRRFFNLAQQRGIRQVIWFEDVLPAH